MLSRATTHSDLELRAKQEGIKVGHRLPFSLALQRVAAPVVAIAAAVTSRTLSLPSLPKLFFQPYNSVVKAAPTGA